jgi:hypothetical protein
MTSSVQLEREAEQTRSQLAQTLDELRQRITPGQLVDQAVDYAKDSGGAQFVRNLSRQATSNPMPVALIGAGMAWLMLSNDRQPSASRATSVDRASKNTDAAAQRADQRLGSGGGPADKGLAVRCLGSVNRHARTLPRQGRSDPKHGRGGEPIGKGKSQ